MEVARELDLALENLLVDGHGVIVVEGVNASEHLVGEDSERPPIDRLGVALVQEDFRCDVLWCTANSVCSLLDLLVDQNVLRLQVTVDNVERVQVLEHQSNLCRVEPMTAELRGKVRN